jgi:hypothetical protein
MKRKEAIVLALLLALSCKAEKSAAPAADAATETAASAGQSDFQRAALQSQAAPKPAAPAMPRIVIRNAQMSLIVADAVPVADKLAALAGSVGGYVSDSKRWREGQQLRAQLTLRVPGPRLDETLAAARRLATRVESENIDSNDVTQEYVDLDAQVRNLEAAETEMRQLMGDVRQRMKKAEDILEVYQHLTELRGQIEQAKGRMRYLSQMAALATIKIDLIPDAIAKPVVEPGWQPVAVMRDASRVLVHTLQALATAVIWCVIYLLPVVLLFALAALIVRGVVRAARRRRTPSAESVP